MIQVAVVGDKETAFFAAKRGFVVLGIEEELQESVKKGGSIFVLFGDGEADVKIAVKDAVEAIRLMVSSADAVIVANGARGDVVKEVAILLKKPLVEGSGKEAVEKAMEKLVRFNLFGKK